MNLTVIGTGYVGLVSAACFAEMGNNVTCFDIDIPKIENLKKGVLPIYESGLDLLISKNCKEGRLRFTTSFPEAITSGNIHFVAVGTPPSEDGSADIEHVLAVARQIGQHINEYGVIVNKSTVPVGTAEKVSELVQKELDFRGVAVPFDVVSNPEFLKEGVAVRDFMSPDRVVVGSQSEKARDIMRELYQPFLRNHERMLFMGVREAEMTKYVANAMLAARVSFMNEVANLCDRMAVDVESVRVGIGSDPRIGYSYLYAGCGYGGACFPKDVKALIRMAHGCGVEPLILDAVQARNELQKGVLFDKITERFGPDLSGLTFGIWGLAFKPETDDLREAPSIALLHQLINAGAKARVYDPVAMERAKRELPNEWHQEELLQYREHQYEAVVGVDALVLVTEWRVFRNPDLHLMSGAMKQRVIFDGRNQYDPARMREHGFEYSGIGR